MSTARKILQSTGLCVWNNKTLDQMSDDECEKCLKYIERATQSYYIPTLSFLGV
jgi:hypothetical protein